jgi:transcription-repair coupling factor (superfamily II helicase)
VRLLEQAVLEAGGNTAEIRDGDSGAVSSAVSCVVDIKSDAFIPEGYVTNPAQRIAVYKKIAEIRGEPDAADVADELTDRYGVIPKSVRGLIEAARLRNMAGRLGICEIAQNKTHLVFYWENPAFELLTRLSEKYAKRFELNLTGRVSVTVKLGKVMWNERGQWKEMDEVDDVLEFTLGFLKELSIK